MDNVQISVVAPVFNEEDVIEEFYRCLHSVLMNLSSSYEIIFVDDGGTDNSLNIMKNLQKDDHRIKIIEFARNFGHQVAISAGIDHASGEAIVVMDSDLQDPPEIIPDLLKKLNQGYDIVYAIRKKRKENIFKKSAYAIFYRLFNKISYFNIPLDAGDFCIMNKEVAKLLTKIPERNRFVRGIRSWIGYKQIGIEYERSKRYAGEVKYSFIQLLKLGLDGIFSFSYLPLRIASILGFIISTISFIGIVVVLYVKLFMKNAAVGFASTRIMILLIGGIQLIILGIVGEYLGRIYDEVRQRPLYIVKKLHGFEQE